jgi:uncharacterized protein involved in exopolysaccharide biosynthesis
MVLVTALGLAAVVGVVNLLKAPTFTARASFIADSPGSSRIAGLAAQFGVSVPSDDGGRSPEFYAGLISSRAVMEAVALRQYEFQVGGERFRGNLIDLYRIPGGTEADRRDGALRHMGGVLRANVGIKTGQVAFSVRSKWAPLAALMAQEVLRQVNAFNVRRQQTRANAEKEFAEERLSQIRAELSSAENDLAQFDMSNRDTQSPNIRLQRDRLERAVELRQQVYTSLEQIYEQARIDALRSTPAITVVDEPIVPYRRDSRFIVAKVMLSLLLGGALGFFLARWMEQRDQARLRFVSAGQS